ncbi:MAG: type IV pilus twitching motility protein PilT [Gemmatimonadetes bacterium]|nr:type IV pilus twitching motility protein PilT [Gemmatimonadota bacterium]
MVTLRALLEEMAKVKASDLHITAGVPAQLRVDGELTPSKVSGVLTPDLTQRLAYSALNDEQKKKFENTNELDFSFGVKGLARFRGNAFVQRGVVTLVIRMIPFEVTPFESLGLPNSVQKLGESPQGLVLLTGPTGSGKSTTLASLIDRINNENSVHIVTIEDPIEFMHSHKRAIINQREVGADTHSFHAALKHVLRQDPDVILLGEMRDAETMETALTVAETGHLCFATLHTNSAVESISRIVDSFPSDRHNQVFSQLAFVLKGVVTQALLPKTSGNGRAMCAEVMVCTPAISALIREGKTHQIYSLIQAGHKHGMQTMNQSLQHLVTRREVTYESAIARSPDPRELQGMLGRGNAAVA